jgi:SanA protein
VPGLSWLLFKLIFVSKIQKIENLPSTNVAVVFGAGLRYDGTPTAILRDRVQTAANLYHQGKVKKLLFSGDNRFIEYNEPGSMRAYALTLNVAPEDIILDYAGRRTYDTCYRAKYIFDVNEAILVTQNFHLPRALFLCNQIGIDATGVNADLRTYSRRSFIIWNIREALATMGAMVDVWIRHPIPVLGDPQPIQLGKTE